MVEEETVGIKCYVNSVPGFRGILKQRYSDFIVNEVDCDGNVVHLTCLDAPVEVSSIQSCEFERQESAVENEELDNVKLLEHVEALKIIAGDSNAELVKGLLIKISEGAEDILTPVLLHPDSDKSHRTLVHNFFKGRLSFLVTDTVDGPDSRSKRIRIRFDAKYGGKGNGSHGKRRRDCRGKWSRYKRQKPEGPEYDSRGKDDWLAQKGKYLQFHLYKENKDTQDALMVIGKMLGVQPKWFGFAGTKDKRAVTTQRVTVFKQASSRLAALNIRLYGMKVGDFCYVDKGLALGQLSGNRFTITLRGVIAENDESIKNAAEGMRRSGFINYFGLQRFGTGSVPTFMIGAALLRGEWKNAVDLILQPRDGERKEISEAREYFMKTKDADGALLRMPHQRATERAVLTGLRKYPGNFLQAINNIPRTMRMMYVHSYQSYLWNHAASKRIQEYGIHKVVEGDIVYSENVKVEVEMGRQEFSENTNEVIVADVIENIEDDADAAISEVLFQVKHVTAKDVADEKLSIRDVLLPLPGSKTLLPANSIADVYSQLASEDSLDLQSCSHNVKDYSFLHMPGGYRRLIQLPVDFEWKLLRYHDATQPLVETDLEKIRGSTQGMKGEEGEGNPQKQAQADITVNHIDTTETTCHIPVPENLAYAVSSTDAATVDSTAGLVAIPQTAVVLSFTLPSSCYATMAIREVLKMPTSVAYHKSLNE